MWDYVIGVVVSNLHYFVSREAYINQAEEAEIEPGLTQRTTSGKSPASVAKPQFWAILDGLKLILSSTYLLHVSLFLWLSAVVSSFFYFQV